MVDEKDMVSVVRNGNSLMIVLPAVWRRKNRLVAGDKLEIRENADGSITLLKPLERSDRKAKFESFTKIANKLKKEAK